MRADPWCPTLSQSNWTENFDSLADLIASYPQITRETHFVFVPGPLDITGSSALPRRPILSAFTANLRNKIPKVYFTSNPCRLKFFGQEIVIFREDTMARMLRNTVGVKPNVTGEDLRRYVCMKSTFSAPASLMRGSVGPIDTGPKPSHPTYHTYPTCITRL